MYNLLISYIIIADHYNTMVMLCKAEANIRLLQCKIIIFWLDCAVSGNLCFESFFDTWFRLYGLTFYSHQNLWIGCWGCVIISLIFPALETKVVLCRKDNKGIFKLILIWLIWFLFQKERESIEDSCRSSSYLSKHSIIRQLNNQWNMEFIFQISRW